jgi:threonine/homoserine efflux transporter RhtA
LKISSVAIGIANGRSKIADYWMDTTYNYALKLIAPSTASLFINIVPFITAFASWFILGERLSPVQLSGGFLVIAAAFLVGDQPKKESPMDQGVTFPSID